MLIFSGLGSLLAERVSGGIAIPAAIILLWCGFAWLGLPNLMLATLGLAVRSPARRCCSRCSRRSRSRSACRSRSASPVPPGAGGGFLPWAWGLNGAFSVVATPLANLLAVQGGYDRVLSAAALLYVVALLTYPSARRIASWQDVPAPSPDAG